MKYFTATFQRTSKYFWLHRLASPCTSHILSSILMIVLYYSLSFPHEGSTHTLIFYSIFIIIVYLIIRFVLLSIYKHFLRNYFTLFVNFLTFIFLVILNSSQIRIYGILSVRLDPSLSVLATSHR